MRDGWPKTAAEALRLRAWGLFGESSRRRDLVRRVVLPRNGEHDARRYARAAEMLDQATWMLFEARHLVWMADKIDAKEAADAAAKAVTPKRRKATK